MEMWLKCATLALLTAAAVLISAQAAVILDGQRRREEVPLGSPVTLHCRLKTDMLKRFRVSWYFNQTFHNSAKLQEEFCNKSASNGSMPGFRETCLEYTLSNATQQRSGWYYCCVTVEIPILTMFSSNGTEIIFTRSKESTTYPSLSVVTAPLSLTHQLAGLWMWIWLGASAVVLLVLLSICVVLRRKYRGPSVEDPIYANTRNVLRKQPSPRPGTDNLKTGNLKAVSSFQHPHNPSPRRKSHEDKRRYK